MSNLKTYFCALAAGLGLAGSAAHATPFERNTVAADATFVLHADLDALRPTGIGQFIQNQLDQPEPAAKLAAFQAIFGFDPRKQLHGLTLYGWGTNGVLLVDADFDGERLATLAKAAKAYRNVEYHGHTIGSWIDENKKKDGRTYGVIVGKRVLFGRDETSVTRALDVLDGTSPSLANGSNFAQFAASDDKSIIEGGASAFPLGEAGPQAVILKLTRVVGISISDTDQQVKATLGLVSKDESAASQIAAIGQGLLALLKLQKQNPDASKVADSVQIHQDGAKLTATVTLPEEQLIAALKADAARKAAKKQQHENAEDN